MSKNTFGNFFKVIGETIEKIENSEVVKNVKETTSEKVASVEKYLEKEKETLDSNKNEKQMELRRLINAAKENSHKKNDDKTTIHSSSNHLSDNLKGIYNKIAAELSKLSQNKMIALILGLSGSKDKSELSNLSSTAIREVLLGLVIYLFKTGKSKFVFVTLASMLGYKMYEYFKTQQDSKKQSVDVEEIQVQAATNDKEDNHVDVKTDETFSEREIELADKLVEKVLEINKTKIIEDEDKKELESNTNISNTENRNQEAIAALVQKRRNRRKEILKNLQNHKKE